MAKSIHGDVFSIHDGLDGDMLMEVEDKVENEQWNYYFTRTEALALAEAIIKHFKVDK